jgi:hypothetical protein
MAEWQKENLTFTQETASLYMRFYEHRETISNAVANSDEPLSFREVTALLPKGKPRGRPGGRQGTGQTETPTTPPATATPDPPLARIDDPAAPLGDNVEIMGEPKGDPAPLSSDPDKTRDAAMAVVEAGFLVEAIAAVDQMKWQETVTSLLRHIEAHMMKLRHAANE